MKNPNVFIFSGPGGAGKTTLVSRLFAKKTIKASCLKAVTVTTRKKRLNEKEGVDYFFVNPQEFLYLKNKKFFLESQKVADNYYGTPKLYYTLAKKKKMNLILCIDVKGGLYLKRNLKAGKMITVFITAPSQRELSRRMKKREDGREVLTKRVALAKEELRYAKQYDFLITNKDLDAAVKKAEEIIAAHQ
ncbi:MAG: guanylate kinase [Candidatus Omnitrophica bacterium]|nr:guanylate kinase [Candidatus Omnitrophota bacterium]